jgi:hypothetical protein
MDQEAQQRRLLNLVRTITPQPSSRGFQRPGRISRQQEGRIGRDPHTYVRILISSFRRSSILVLLRC